MEYRDVTVEYRDVTVEVDARMGAGEIPNLYNIIWNLAKVACQCLPLPSLPPALGGWPTYDLAARLCLLFFLM